jgi:hypothetical protein
MAFPVTDDRIVAAETALERRFPDAMRARLQLQNGGDIATEDDDWTLHPVQDTSDRKRLARTASHVVRETAAARSWPGFPAEGIAIASNGSGDCLVLLPGSDAVLLWDHETGTLTQ